MTQIRAELGWEPRYPDLKEIIGNVGGGTVTIQI
jgi:hypothetical protein